MKKPLSIRDARDYKITRRLLLKAIEDAAGSGKGEDHPELRHGSRRFVQMLRRQSDRRLKSD